MYLDEESGAYFPATKLKQGSDGTTWTIIESLPDSEPNWVTRMQDVLPKDELLKFKYYNDLRLSALMGVVIESKMWTDDAIKRVLTYEFSGDELVKTKKKIQLERQNLQGEVLKYLEKHVRFKETPVNIDLFVPRKHETL